MVEIVGYIEKQKREFVSVYFIVTVLNHVSFGFAARSEAALSHSETQAAARTVRFVNRACTTTAQIFTITLIKYSFTFKKIK